MLRLDGSTPGCVTEHTRVWPERVGALPASAGKILQVAACNLLDDHWQDIGLPYCAICSPADLYYDYNEGYNRFFLR